MNIVLGSTSPQKLEILQRTLEGKLFYRDIELVNVESSAKSQPLSLNEAEQVAIDSAKEALAMRTNAGLAVGMEWGLEEVGVTKNLVCVVVFWDGKEVIKSQSGLVLLPQIVSEGIKQGKSFIPLLQEYHKTAPPEELARITDLTSQELPYIHAIRKALPLVKNQINLDWRMVFSTLLAPRYKVIIFLGLTALLSFIYFIGKAILGIVWDIAYLFKTEVIWDMFALFNLLAPLLLSSWLICLYLFYRPQNLRRFNNARLGIQLSIASTTIILFMSVAISLLTWPGLVNNDILAWLQQYATTLILYGLIVAACFTATHVYLFSTWWKSEAISTTTTILLAIGVACIPASWLPSLPWLSFATTIFVPLILAGVSWCYGVWRLGQEIFILDTSRYDNEFSKPPPIISPYLPEKHS